MPTAFAIVRRYANTGTYFLTDKNRPYAQVIEERTDNTAHDLIVAYTYGDDLISQTRPGRHGHHSDHPLLPLRRADVHAADVQR
jgi:hypothetical protein